MRHPLKWYAIIPLTVMLLCFLLLWVLPWMLIPAEFNRDTAHLMLYSCIAVMGFGGALGICINILLEKKLPKQSYEKLVNRIRMIVLFLWLLAGIGGILWFGSRMHQI